MSSLDGVLRMVFMRKVADRIKKSVNAIRLSGGTIRKPLNAIRMSADTIRKFLKILCFSVVFLCLLSGFCVKTWGGEASVVLMAYFALLCLLASRCFSLSLFSLLWCEMVFPYSVPLFPYFIFLFC